MTVQYVEKVYNSYSRFYDQIFGKVFESGRVLAPQLLNLFPDAEVLEVGVGTGLALEQLPRNLRVTGIDLSQKMLDEAQKRVTRLNLTHVTLLRMDANQLQFPDHSFDRVLAAYFISTVPDPVQVVREMIRVCRPGGCLVFLNHFQSEHPVLRRLEQAISPLCYRLGFKTDLDLARLMQDTGLAIDRLEEIDFRGHWKAVRCPRP